MFLPSYVLGMATSIRRQPPHRSISTDYGRGETPPPPSLGEKHPGGVFSPQRGGVHLNRVGLGEGGVFLPFGGGFITTSGGVVLGGFSSTLGGGGASPRLRGGGGLRCLRCHPTKGGGCGPSLCEPQITVLEDRLLYIYMLCCAWNLLGGGLAPFPFQISRSEVMQGHRHMRRYF